MLTRFAVIQTGAEHCSPLTPSRSSVAPCGTCFAGAWMHVFVDSYRDGYLLAVREFGLRQVTSRSPPCSFFAFTANDTLGCWVLFFESLRFCLFAFLLFPPFAPSRNCVLDHTILASSASSPHPFSDRLDVDCLQVHICRWSPCAATYIAAHRPPKSSAKSWRFA